MLLKTSVFCQKAKKNVHFGPHDLVQISPACGPNACAIIYGNTLDFQWQYLQPQHGRVLVPNLLQKRIFRFYVTISDADNESLKFFHTLFDKYLDHMLGNFQKIVWYKIYNFF